MKILLIEDELKTLTFIKQGLVENGYEVDTADDGKAGKQLAMDNPYDLIITDIIMPQLDGRTLCLELRKAKIQTPLLMLTALGGPDQVVEGLDSGADDYLAKPFEFKELLARIRALSKRSKISSNDSKLAIQDLEMDLDAKTVIRSGKKIPLTAKEYALLEYFLRNKGKVVSRTDITRHVWNLDFDTRTNMVEVYVNYLRKKIDRDFEKKLIHTQFGMGYVMNDE